MKKTLITLAVIMGIVGGAYLSGLRVHYVASGSMSPAIPKYSLVFSKTVDAFDKIEENDVIIFKERGVTMPIMHRVVEKTADYVVTRGDANKNNDTRTSFDNIKEIVVFHVPVIGYVVSLIHTDAGSGIFISLIIILTAVAFWPPAVKNKAYDSKLKKPEIY